MKSLTVRWEVDVAEGTYFKTDSRWIALGYETAESLMSSLALPEIVECVPAEISTRLERIERALRLSLVEYELLDVTADYALVTVELAFKLRYRQHVGKAPKKYPKYAALIDWAETEGLLSGLDSRANMLRRFRNNAVHPQSDSFGGVAFVPVFKYVFAVVNSLYSAECLSVQ